MKRYVVISTNNNPDYFAYMPYQEKAWNNLGWDLIIMVTPDFDTLNFDIKNPETLICRLPYIPELRTQTVAQAGRLYAAHYVSKDSILMTCDMDLIPLSDYWSPDPKDITVYGHDLTDFTYYPMGYVAMTAQNWIYKMQIGHDIKSDMLRDANNTLVNGNKIAFAEDWGSWWNYDWQLLTNRLSPSENEIKFINRGRRSVGQHKGVFAYGRVDRGDSMQVPQEPLIDAHCENNNVLHPDKWQRFLNVFEKAHGKL